MNKQCGNCRYWSLDENGFSECRRIGVNSGSSFAEITVEAVFPSYERIYLQTSEDFYCNLWVTNDE